MLNSPGGTRDGTVLVPRNEQDTVNVRFQTPLRNIWSVFRESDGKVIEKSRYRAPAPKTIGGLRSVGAQISVGGGGAEQIGLMSIVSTEKFGTSPELCY